MYKINDYIIYNKEVCRVEQILKKFHNDLDYYELSTMDDASLKLKVPVNNKSIRDIISKEEALRIINSISDVSIIEADNKQIENEYKKLLNTNKYEDLIKIIKTSYLRNKERVDNKRKISEKDKHYFEKAEKLLYNEFSISLGLSYDETKEYIISRVKHLK